MVIERILSQPRLSQPSKFLVENMPARPGYPFGTRQAAQARTTLSRGNVQGTMGRAPQEEEMLIVCLMSDDSLIECLSRASCRIIV